MKIIFGSVIFPNSIKYFDDYIKSVNAQDFSDGKLLLLNDGIDNLEIESIKRKIKVPFDIVNIYGCSDIVKNRIMLISEAKKSHADLLIIGDSDDFFSSNRIKAYENAYACNPEYGFYYNDLHYIDDKEVMPAIPKITNSVEQITDYNYIGMSNSAINLNKLDFDFINSLMECKSNIFDWYLYTRLLLKGLQGHIVEGTYTFYRIYDGNIAGNVAENYSISFDDIEKERKVKIEHYKNLVKYADFYRDMIDIYENRKYSINGNQKNYFWWDFLKRRKKSEI